MLAALRALAMLCRGMLAVGRFEAVSAAHVGHVLRREVVQDVGGAPQGARDEGVPRVHVQRRIRPAAGAHKPSGECQEKLFFMYMGGSGSAFTLLPAPECVKRVLYQLAITGWMSGSSLVSNRLQLELHLRCR